MATETVNASDRRFTLRAFNNLMTILKIFCYKKSDAIK